MNQLLRKNYLRSSRKKLGLSQKHLGFLLGLQTGCTISALENGRKAPNLAEVFTFEKLFSRSVSHLWPSWAAEREAKLDYRIRGLVDVLQKSQVRSNRRRKRADYLLRRLEALQHL